MVFAKKYTVLDNNSKLRDYESEIELIEETETFLLECKKFGVPCSITIKNNETKKIYSFEEFKKIRVKYGRK